MQPLQKISRKLTHNFVTNPVKKKTKQYYSSSVVEVKYSGAVFY